MGQHALLGIVDEPEDRCTISGGRFVNMNQKRYTYALPKNSRFDTLTNNQKYKQRLNVKYPLPCISRFVALFKIVCGGEITKSNTG